MEQELAPAREQVREQVPAPAPAPALVRGPALVQVQVQVQAVERRMTVEGYRRHRHRRQTR